MYDTTPVHLAAEAGHADCLQLLIDNEGSVNQATLYKLPQWGITKGTFFIIFGLPVTLAYMVFYCLNFLLFELAFHIYNYCRLQQDLSISNFGISNFRFYRTMVNGPATINANKCIWLISNLGYTEPLMPVP